MHPVHANLCPESHLFGPPQRIDRFPALLHPATAVHCRILYVGTLAMHFVCAEVNQGGGLSFACVLCACARRESCFQALSSLEYVEAEADERRFYKEVILLSIKNRKTRFWVVARPQLRVVEHCSIEISF
jgi:hypothetical protein